MIVPFTSVVFPLDGLSLIVMYYLTAIMASLSHVVMK